MHTVRVASRKRKTVSSTFQMQDSKEDTLSSTAELDHILYFSSFMSNYFQKRLFYLFSFFISTSSVLQQLIVFSNILFSKLKKVCSKKCANSQATLLQGHYREHTFCSKKSYLKKRNFAKIMKFLWFLSFPKVPLPLIQENDCINDTHERAQKEEKLNVLYLSLPRYLL